MVPSASPFSHSHPTTRSPTGPSPAACLPPWAHFGHTGGATRSSESPGMSLGTAEMLSKGVRSNKDLLIQFYTRHSGGNGGHGTQNSALADKVGIAHRLDSMTLEIFSNSIIL